MMTAQQVCDVIAAGTQPGMTPNDMADFIQGRIANVDADIVEAGVRLASIEFRRQAERQLAEADELARFKRNRRLRVV